MPSAEEITKTVNRYIELVSKGTADEIADLFASDATVEDPVGGGEIHIGRQAIHGFFANVAGLEREAELVTLRVAGNEAAFQFWIKVGGALIEPIDVMVFNDAGEVQAMKSYWSPESVSQL
ncbi:MAG: nuclear transport factor 2 family protein [Mycobacterium sp.]